MATRRITGPLFHPRTKTPWANATITVTLLTIDAVMDDGTIPEEEFTITTDENGDFDELLGAPDDGSAWLWLWRLPGKLRGHNLRIGAGADTTLHQLIAEQSNEPPLSESSVAALLGTYVVPVPDGFGYVDYGFVNKSLPYSHLEQEVLDYLRGQISSGAVEQALMYVFFDSNGSPIDPRLPSTDYGTDPNDVYVWVTSPYKTAQMQRWLTQNIYDADWLFDFDANFMTLE